MSDTIVDESTLIPLKINSDGSINIASLRPSLQLQIEYNVSNDPLYIGLAESTATAGSSKWQIRKAFYDGNANLIKLVYASTETTFNKVWNNRTGYSY